MEQVPKEVWENVLRRLSEFDIVRAGCASQALRSLARSHRITSSLPRVSLLLLLHPDAQVEAASPLFDSCWAYDPDRASWLTISVAFLRPYLPEYAYPVASDGGLVCLGSGRNFIVCNPITKSWKKLPFLTQMEPLIDEDSLQAFGLSYDTTSGTYDLFVLNHRKSQSQSVSILASYSSSSSQWSCMPKTVMPDTSCELHSNAIIACNSRLYTLWQRGTYLTIFACSNGTWSEQDVPECSGTLLKAFLMNVNGSLYMVGAVGAVWLRDNYWKRPNSVRIWKLQAQNDSWVNVTRMPMPILQEFQERIDFNELQCWGKNGILHMRSLTSEVLMLNLATNEWTWLNDLGVEAETLGLIFEPSLAATA